MKTSPTMMKSVAKNSNMWYIIKHRMDSDFMNVGNSNRRYIKKHGMDPDLFLLCSNCLRVFTPQPLMAVGVLFLPMVSRWAGVRAVSQKL